MSYTNLIGKHKTEVDTPALLLDIGAAERNIKKMADFFKDKQCKLRPHCKTHKFPLIANKQIEAGAIGVTCATIKEAEVMAQSGIRSILIANQIVGKSKIQRLINLLDYGDIIICIDNYDNAKRISEAAGTSNKKVNILVEINVGLYRCGVAPEESSLDLVQKVSRLDNIVFRGLMGYEGGLFIKDVQEKKEKCTKANTLLLRTRELIETNGFNVEITSAGGSNTYNLTGLCPGITEIQVGSYVTMDSHDREFGLDFEQALFVMSTVISRPDKTRAVIDVGKKAISCDEGLPLCKIDGINLFRLNEEHGHIKIENSESSLSVGDKIELVPSHGCTTIPLFDEYVIIRDDCVECIEDIKARNW